MTGERWSVEKANQWYQKQPWLRGCNFIPSTAINQLEMWQAETFDLDTINCELSWAAELGLNVMRVYLHDLVWFQDPAGFKVRIDQYLEVSDRHRTTHRRRMMRHVPARQSTSTVLQRGLELFRSALFG